MRTPVVAILMSALLLSGCGAIRESRLNPFNWFGQGRQEERVQTASVEAALATDPRGVVAQIVSLDIDATPGGAIIRAVGLPATQGYYAGELVPENNELPVDGVLTYVFRIAPPLGFELTSTQQSREVIVGHVVSNIRLEGVRSIRVIGAQNTLISRR